MTQDCLSCKCIIHTPGSTQIRRHLLAAHMLRVEDGPEPLRRRSRACSTLRPVRRRCCYPSHLIILMLHLRPSHLLRRMTSNGASRRDRHSGSGPRTWRCCHWCLRERRREQLWSRAAKRGASTPRAPFKQRRIFKLAS
jgi:hypothetical protein